MKEGKVIISSQEYRELIEDAVNLERDKMELEEKVSNLLEQIDAIKTDAIETAANNMMLSMQLNEINEYFEDYTFSKEMFDKWKEEKSQEEAV